MIIKNRSLCTAYLFYGNTKECRKNSSAIDCMKIVVAFQLGWWFERLRFTSIDGASKVSLNVMPQINEKNSAHLTFLT